MGLSVPARCARSERRTGDDLEDELVGEVVHGGGCVRGGKEINSRGEKRDGL